MPDYDIKSCTKLSSKEISLCLKSKLKKHYPLGSKIVEVSGINRYDRYDKYYATISNSL